MFIRLRGPNRNLGQLNSSTVQSNPNVTWFTSKDINNKESKYSCWGEIEPAWLNDAEEEKDHRVYVHEEILVWLVELLNKSILNEDVAATVEQVFHHNLNGQIYLIKFYFKRKLDIDTNNKIRFDQLGPLKDQMKYKMLWKSRPTYFLRIDSIFENRKSAILKELEKLNLNNCFSTILLDVNWMCIPKIEIYELIEDLSDDQVNKIDSIFQDLSKAKSPIYICKQFEWHYEFDSDFDLDAVAMDMCVEEWCRYDLLKTFSIDEVLNIDLSNKDYRDPYFNSYLERYVDILLKRHIPELFTENDVKIAFPSQRWPAYLDYYYFSRFHDKLAVTNDEEYLYNTYDMTNLEQDNILYLNGSLPTPENLLKLRYESVEYHISNYSHFSGPLIRALLSKWNSRQVYKIQFDCEFNFPCQVEPEFEPKPINEYKWWEGDVSYHFTLNDCIESNSEKLVQFMRYLIGVLKETNTINAATVSLTFNNCIIEDFTFLQNIATCIYDINFQKMVFTSQQLQSLSCTLTQQTVTFEDCQDITDSNVMTLLKNIDSNNLKIRYKHACSPAIYFLMAEYLMTKENVKIIEGYKIYESVVYFNDTNNLYKQFREVVFVVDGDQIVMKNCSSKENVDLYCMINGIENDGMDSSNNVYME